MVKPPPGGVQTWVQVPLSAFFFFSLCVCGQLAGTFGMMSTLFYIINKGYVGRDVGRLFRPQGCAEGPFIFGYVGTFFRPSDCLLFGK